MAGGAQEWASNLFRELPEEVVFQIFGKLSISGLAVAQCVSKEFRAAASAPELWANVPLLIETGSIRRLNDKWFMDILARAQDIPRMNIEVLDFGEGYGYSPSVLEALVRKVDAQALPPTTVDFSESEITSRELVPFLRSLDKKLAARWNKKTTRLWIQGVVYESDVAYLEKFLTTRTTTDTPGWPYDFMCPAGCENSFEDARFCCHCQVHACLCHMERNCDCGAPVCGDCPNVCPECEDEFGVLHDSDEDLDFEDWEDEESICVHYSRDL